MSLIAITLGQQPFIPPLGIAKAYDADTYRPARSASPAIDPPEINPSAAPITPPPVHHMVQLSRGNRRRIRAAILAGHTNYPAIRAATLISKYAIYRHLNLMLENGEITVVPCFWPRQYAPTARLLHICEVES